MPLTHPQSRKITAQDFSKEILTDLDSLITQNEMGVTISTLQDYYGESVQRVAKAIEILVQQDRIERHKGPKGVTIWPKGYQTPRPHPELTTMQWNLLQWLQQNTNHKHIVKTNFSQAAEQIHASLGGTKNTFHRLATLNHIKILQEYNDQTRYMLLEVLTMPSSNDFVIDDGLDDEEDAA